MKKDQIFEFKIEMYSDSSKDNMLINYDKTAEDVVVLFLLNLVNKQTYESAILLLNELSSDPHHTESVSNIFNKLYTKLKAKNDKPIMLPSQVFRRDK